MEEVKYRLTINLNIVLYIIYKMRQLVIKIVIKKKKHSKSLKINKPDLLLRVSFPVNKKTEKLCFDYGIKIFFRCIKCYIQDR